MKAKLTAAILLLSTTFGFAEEPTLTQVSQTQIAPLPEMKAPDPLKKGTIYFRAMTDAQPKNNTEVFPGLGVGYRRSFGHSGVDVSLNYCEGKGWKGNQKQIVWTAPKVSYLYYFDPIAERSFYSGVGLGWGGAYFKNRADEWEHDHRKDSQFFGLVPHVSIGYEALRHSAVTSFTEFSISQPLVPREFKGAMPGPAAELSVGAGF